LRIFCESFSLGSLLNQSQTYQGNPYGIYPDLSFLSRSGIIQTLCLVSSDLLLVRITSSGIRASALDTGSILSNFYFYFFLFVICLRFVFCSVICVLVCVSVCVLVCMSVCVLVSILFRCCFALVLASLCFKFLFQFCLGTIFLSWMNLGFRRSNCLIAY